MSADDFDVRGFDADAVLRKYRGTSCLASRRAPFGLLLNRVRRMHIPKGTTIEIICGHVVHGQDDIVYLTNSAAYRRWLTTPLPSRRQGKKSKTRGRGE